MIAMISGGFDPLHCGHIELIELAAAHGDVVVALNSDAWLMRKKGFVFMSRDERKLMLKSTKYVAAVIAIDDADDTVCAALKGLKPDFFVNGGDRNVPDSEEDAVCRQLNITQIFGGDKIQSSQALVKAAR